MQTEKYITISREELIQILEKHFKDNKIPTSIKEIHVNKNGIRCLVE